jgi:hypothetical protein
LERIEKQQMGFGEIPARIILRDGNANNMSVNSMKSFYQQYLAVISSGSSGNGSRLRRSKQARKLTKAIRIY